MATKVPSRLYTRVLEDCKLRRKVGVCVHGHIYAHCSQASPTQVRDEIISTPHELFMKCTYNLIPNLSLLLYTVPMCFLEFAGFSA